MEHRANVLQAESALEIGGALLANLVSVVLLVAETITHRR